MQGINYVGQTKALKYNIYLSKIFYCFENLITLFIMSDLSKHKQYILKVTFTGCSNF